jgi:hypothetical protein
MNWVVNGSDTYMQTASGTFGVEEFYVVARYDGSGSQFLNYEGLLNPANTSQDGWFVTNAGATDLYFDTPSYVNGSATNNELDFFPEAASTFLVRCKLGSGSFTTTSGVVMGFDRLFTGSPRGWNGFICECLAFTTALPSGNRAGLEAYLIEKWGI